MNDKADARRALNLLEIAAEPGEAGITPGPALDGVRETKTKKRVPKRTTVTKLRRTETQRRADALLAMAQAAAACPPDRSRPLPTVNFLLDENTAAAAADNQPLDPSNYRDVISRTDRGPASSSATICRVRRSR